MFDCSLPKGDYLMILCRTLFVVLVCHFVFTANYSKAEIFLIPGDYNGDGIVDLLDALTWEFSYGSTSEPYADGNQNGIVDQADYDILYENFGRVASLTGARSNLAAGTDESVVSLLYDPNTGDLSLDPDDSADRIYAFKLITTGVLNQGVANAPFQQFVADPNGVLPDGNTFVQTVTEIGQIAISGNGLPDEGFNLGPILPVGLSASELQTQLGGSQIFGASGGQLGTIEFVEIPEPATLWGILVSSGILFAVGRQSTRRCAV